MYSEDVIETLATLNCMLIESVQQDDIWMTVYHAYMYIVAENNVTAEHSRLISIASAESWRVGRAQGRAI
jgi:hypothetical protein